MSEVNKAITLQQAMTLYDDLRDRQEALVKSYEQLTFPVNKGTLCLVGKSLRIANQDILTSEVYTPAHWEETDISEELTDVKNAIQGKYTKPSGGIPASDIADGVIPVVDSALSDSSENAIQNKVVKGALDTKAPVIINTATGNPAVFSDGADGLPIQSLKVHLLPRQEGTGDPSPENVRSIIPWNGLTVFGGGKNHASGISNRFNMQNIGGVWNNSVTDSKTYFQAVVQLYNGSTYIKYITGKTIEQTGMYVLTFNIDVPDCDTIVFKHSGSQNDLALQFPFSGEQGEYTISFNVLSVNPSELGGLKISTIEMVKGTPTDTDIVFPTPIYGGTLDVVSGVLTVEWAKTILTGDSAENWRKFTNAESGNNFRFWTEALSDRLYANGVNGTQKSNYLAPTSGDTSSGSSVVITSIRQGITFFASNVRTYVYVPDLISTESDIDGWRAYLAQHPLEVCYKLATPQEITLTPEQIIALKGNNTIWSDANGDIEIEYRADTGLFLKQNTVKDVQVSGSSVTQSGVANIPMAGTSTPGVIKRGRGLYVDGNGATVVDFAGEAQIKAGNSEGTAINPNSQHKSAFYALAKLAGADMKNSSNPVGQFTDEAKVAIQKMLGIYEAPWELIREDTFTNASEANHEITVDANGEAFSLTDLILYFETPVQDTASSKGVYGQLWFYDDQNIRYAPECGAWTQAAGATQTHGCGAIIEQKNGMLFIGNLSSISDTNNNNLRYRYLKGFDSNPQHGILLRNEPIVITKVIIPAVTGVGHYKLYGKRKWN